MRRMFFVLACYGAAVVLLATGGLAMGQDCDGRSCSVGTRQVVSQRAAQMTSATRAAIKSTLTRASARPIRLWLRRR